MIVVLPLFSHLFCLFCDSAPPHAPQDHPKNKKRQNSLAVLTQMQTQKTWWENQKSILFKKPTTQFTKDWKYYIKNTKLKKVQKIPNTGRKCTIHTQSNSEETTSRRLRMTKAQKHRRDRGRHRQASTGKLN